MTQIPNTEVWFSEAGIDGTYAIRYLREDGAPKLIYFNPNDVPREAALVEDQTAVKTFTEHLGL